MGGISSLWVRSTPADGGLPDVADLTLDVGDSTAAFMREELAFFVPARFPGRVASTIGLLGLLLLVGTIFYLGKRGVDPRTFPVNEVEVSGTLDYTDRDHLRERVIEHARVGFYALDLDAIRTDIKRMPWIADAHIRRISPDRLSIEVTEHEAAARWNDDSLISKRFELFKPPQLLSDSIQRAEWLAHFSMFPQLRGSDGRHEAVLAAFRRYQADLVEFGVKIDALLEDARHSQTLILENQVSVRLGSSARDVRMKRFIDVYQLLVPNADGQAVKFDMRYRNGLAVTQPGSPRAFGSLESAVRSTLSVDSSLVEGTAEVVTEVGAETTDEGEQQ